MTPLQICQQCQFRKRPCGGACPCSLDGVDIRTHAQSGDCPNGYFAVATSESAGESQPPQPVPIQPVPRRLWPDNVNAIADMREPEDIGVGDTIERGLGTGGMIFKALVAALDKTCGCTDRRKFYNSIYPY
jgi:hypothetical protein